MSNKLAPTLALRVPWSSASLWTRMYSVNESAETRVKLKSKWMNAQANEWGSEISASEWMRKYEWISQWIKAQSMEGAKWASNWGEQVARRALIRHTEPVNCIARRTFFVILNYSRVFTSCFVIDVILTSFRQQRLCSALFWSRVKWPPITWSTSPSTQCSLGSLKGEET